MESKFLFLFLASTQVLLAQTFTDAPQSIPFADVYNSDAAFADVDGDNDPDLLISGQPGSNLKKSITKLYINDGTGNFTEMMNTPFKNVTNSSIAFADVDGDNDQDVLISGLDSFFVLSARLYINDGGGNFTQKMGTPFVGIEAGTIVFADVDGDNDPDLLITGRTSQAVLITKLYTNDGGGSFAEKVGTPFPGLNLCAAAFADVDGDNDPDLLISGNSTLIGQNSYISKLYINDGAGNFTEKVGTSIEAVAFASLAFADVDGDNDQDLLITGRPNGIVGAKMKLYINDGMGNFSEKMGGAFDGLISASITFADVDGDNDQDVLIAGQSDSLQARVSELFTNDGGGNFTVMTGTPFLGVNLGAVVFADVDGDNDQDIFMCGATGAIGEYIPLTKLYKNNLISSSDDVKMEIISDLMLYPNPSATGTLYLSYEAVDYEEVAVKVYNTNGVLLRQQRKLETLGQQTISIDIASLPKGNYYIEVDNGKRKGVAKFIVQ